MKAIIFDLDGTLIDTVTDLADSANAVLTRHAFPIKDYKQYESLVGYGIAHLLTKSLPQNVKSESEIAALVAEMKQEYGSRWKLHTKPYPQTSQLLDALTQKNIPLAILSNKEEAFVNEIVSHIFNSWKFNHVVGASSDFIPKPDPSGALSIAKNLSVLPQEFLFVGDSDIDMQTAKNANMQPVFCTWGYQKYVPTIPALIIKQPVDILNYFL